MKQYFKFFILLTFVFIHSWVNALTCNDEKLISTLVEIKILSNKKQLVAGYKKIDSLTFVLSQNHDTTCHSFYKLQSFKGLILIRDDKIGEAIIHFTDLINKLHNTNHKDLLAHAYLSLALIHELLERKEACKNNLDLANEIITKFKLKEPSIRYYVRLSSYERIFNRNKIGCVEFARKALANMQYFNDLNDLADAYLLISLCEVDKNIVEEFRNKAIEMHYLAQDYMGGFYVSFQRFNDLYKSGEIVLANAYLDTLKLKFLDAIHENSIEKFDGLSRYYLEKKNIAKSFNNFKEALTYSELYYQSIFEKIKIENQKVLNKKQEEYLYEKEQKVTKSLIEKNSQLKVFLIGSISFLAILVVLLYYNNRNQVKIKNQKEIIKKSIEETSSLNQKNELLLTEVHHRVKNSLQNAISILHLKQGLETDEGIKLSLENTSNRIRCISLIHEQLYQTQEFENINVKQYLIKIINLYDQMNFQLKDIKFHVTVVDDLYLNFDTMMPMGLITNELVTNSIKYAKTNDVLEINMSVQRINKVDYAFDYFDNGKISGLEKQAGMGLILIESMIRQLNTNVEVKNGFNIGFVFREKITSKV